MSRTIRRTRDKKRNKSGRSNFVETWITYRECNIFGRGTGRRIPLTGKEYWKGYWKFYGDSIQRWGNPPYSRKHFEDKCRIKNKNELNRYLKDNEYEVMMYKPGCLSWER